MHKLIKSMNIKGDDKTIFSLSFNFALMKKNYIHTYTEEKIARSARYSDLPKIRVSLWKKGAISSMGGDILAALDLDLLRFERASFSVTVYP